MSTRLVATVMAHSPDTVAPHLSDPPDGVSFVELRLDALAEPTPENVVALLDLPRSVPLIAACHPSEGGEAGGPEPLDDGQRLALLVAAANAGADLLDVDDRLLDRLPGDLPAELIASCHMKRFMPRLDALARRIASHGVRFGKLAVPANTPLQLAELLDLQEQMGEDFAVVPTGRLAEAGRVMVAGRGAALCYGAADEHDRGHPDQPDVARLHAVHHVEPVGGHTRFYAVVGRPVAHSLSPAYHNVIFRSVGRDARMVALDVDDLADVLGMADMLRLDGLAVTHPFKTDAIELAAMAMPGSMATGAANTLLRTPNGWQARNTDWKAACDLMPKIIKRWRKDHPGAKPRVLLLGAGGAARAMAIALSGEDDVIIDLWGRDGDRAQQLADDLATRWLPEPGDERWDLIINATPVGMAGDVEDTLPVRARHFEAGALALDLAYGGEHSSFREAAGQAGAQMTEGEDFFLQQARRQAELFCGAAVPADVHKLATASCRGEA